MSSSRALRAWAAAVVALLAGCRTAAQSARGSECALPPGDELVNVRRIDRTIRADVRYATSNNFTGRRLPGYERPRAMLRPSAAAALGRVQARLRTEGLGLKVFDAYRPVRATLAMVDWAERSGNRWVLDQGYVARRSGHNLGITVDLTLVDLRTGRELAMGTPFDTFSEAAHTANATGEVMENRLRLKRAMEAEGFANYDQEWWHYRMAGGPPPLDVPLRCFP
ncbi:M15 family metallopeptidase [Longimicrobium sp.]|uniref:M15 family metallopeptidase n=1 Tax=Longimicrobium sp. TaxID=2029185 RepID=UPI002B87D997|nr:M15 family metallopeptidase [Longimicrobium sp.]HSU17408.1 M15 family metallopeptidase [Longimicrobium sp.]